MITSLTTSLEVDDDGLGLGLLLSFARLRWFGHDEDGVLGDDVVPLELLGELWNDLDLLLLLAPLLRHVNVQRLL